MPVDPGNLLLIGELGGKPRDRRAGLRPLAQGERLRLGAAALPRAAFRSAAPISSSMGVGGLLMEIVSRPQPRAPGREAVAPSPGSCSPPAARRGWASATS